MSTAGGGFTDETSHRGPRRGSSARPVRERWQGRASEWRRAFSRTPEMRLSLPPRLEPPTSDGLSLYADYPGSTLVASRLLSRTAA